MPSAIQKVIIIVSACLALFFGNDAEVLNQIEANTDHTQIANDINHNIQEIFNTTSQAYIYTRYKADPQIMQEIQTTLNIKSYEMLNNESYQEPIETQQGLENAYYKGFLAKIKLMQTLLETNLCEAPSEMFRQHYKSNKELANFIIKTSKNNLILHKIRISNNPKLSTAASVLQDYMYRLWAHSKDLNCKE